MKAKHPNYPAKVVERFYRRVKKGRHWIWKGTSKTAFPRFNLGKNGGEKSGKGENTGRLVYASHFAWEMAHGPLLPDEILRNACGERLCIRPSCKIKSASAKILDPELIKDLKRKAKVARASRRYRAFRFAEAARLGISESTVRRAITGKAAYRRAKT